MNNALMIVVIALMTACTQPVAETPVISSEPVQEPVPGKAIVEAPESDSLTPEDFMAQIEARRDYYESQPVEECLPEQSPVRISYSFEKHFVTEDLTRLHITDMIFEGYDYKTEYYEFMNCRFGSSKGENTNYIYCGDSFIPIDVKFVDDSGVIIDTVGLSFIFDGANDNKWIKVNCYP
jgi:hypothetical protein